MDIVTRLHRDFPALTYDVTIKVEHLLKHRELVPQLRDTGCAFVVTAVESVDDRVLSTLKKGHNRTNFVEIAAIFRRQRLPLVPTFVAFNPWTDFDGYADLLATIAELDLVNNVAPVQLAIRLLIPQGSKLLELPEVGMLVTGFDPGGLVYRWSHSDRRVDEFYEDTERLVQRLVRDGRGRSEIFQEVWDRLCVIHPPAKRLLTPFPPLPSRATVPYLTEPWYC
jgi:hypothetical protein